MDWLVLCKFHLRTLHTFFNANWNLEIDSILHKWFKEMFPHHVFDRSFAFQTSTRFSPFLRLIFEMKASIFFFLCWFTDWFQPELLPNCSNRWDNSFCPRLLWFWSFRDNFKFFISGFDNVLIGMVEECFTNCFYTNLHVAAELSNDVWILDTWDT